MMTKLMLTIVTIISSQAMAQVKFENPVSQNPVIIDIVKNDGCSHNICYLFDHNGKKRVELTFGKTVNTYSLFNSNEIVIARQVTISSELANSSARQLVTATSACPVKIFINREQIRIADIRPSCNTNGIKKITLVRNDGCSHNICYFYDAAEVKLMEYNLATSIYNIGGSPIAGVNTQFKLDSISADKMKMYSMNVRKTCPMTVEYDMASGKLLKVSLACDPLAFDLNSLIGNG